MTLHFLNDVTNDTNLTKKSKNYIIIASLKSETMGKLINRIPGSRPLISSSPGSPLRMHVESLGKSTSLLRAFPGKLDIKRHSPSILYCKFRNFCEDFIFAKFGICEVS